MKNIERDGIEGAVIHDVEQGTEPWARLRRDYYPASEAATVMGHGMETRNAMIKRYLSASAESGVSEVKQGVFDRGHVAEALVLPMMEAKLGRPLLPLTVTRYRLLASLDGITPDGEILFEHKLSVRPVSVPKPGHLIQVAQQLVVTGAREAWLRYSDDTGADMGCFIIGRELLGKEAYGIVLPDEDALLKAWSSFWAAVLAQGAVPSGGVERIEQSVGELSVVVEGSLTVGGNLAAVHQDFCRKMDALPKAPETEQEYATIDAAVKVCKATEAAVKEARALIDAKAGISAVIAQLESLGDMARSNRLRLTKVVTEGKEAARMAVVERYADAIMGSNAAFPSTLRGSAVRRLAAIAKSYRTLATLEDAMLRESGQVTKDLAGELAVLQAEQVAVPAPVVEVGTDEKEMYYVLVARNRVGDLYFVVNSGKGQELVPCHDVEEVKRNWPLFSKKG